MPPRDRYKRRLDDRLPRGAFEETRRLYFEEMLTMDEVAKCLGIDRGTVRYRIERMGLAPRNNRDSQLLSNARRPRPPRQPPKRYPRKQVVCLDCGHHQARNVGVGVPAGIPEELICQWPAPPWILAQGCMRCGGMVVPAMLRKLSRRWYLPEQIDRMVYYYTERNWPTTQIADHYGCAHSTVCDYLHRRGISLVKRKPRKDRETYRVTVSMWEMYWGEKRTMKEVGEAFGVSAGTVADRFKRAGMARRSPGESLKLVNERKRRAREREEQQPLAEAA